MKCQEKINNWGVPWTITGGFSLTHQSSRVESRRVESSHVESSFPTLKSKGDKLHLLGFFELSMYWYIQTVLQISIYLERTSRAILHHQLGDVKNLLVYIIASYCEVVLYTTHNKLRILELIFVQFIYLIFLVTEIFVTAKMSDNDQNKTLDMKIQHLLDVRNYTRSRTPQIDK